MPPIQQNEAITGLLTDLGIDVSFSSPGLTGLTAVDSVYIRDLRRNVASVLNSSHLTKREAFLLALSVAANEKNLPLIAAFERLAVSEGATPGEVAESHGCASLLSISNIFFRFRHYGHDSDFYRTLPANLRMNLKMNPVVGKEFFELMSLVISAVNGCEKCVLEHEHAAILHGAPPLRISEAVRLGAVIKGLCVTL